MSNDALPTIDYLIGVDGGGTGTRVIVADRQGKLLGSGSAGASGLRNGADFAWNSILKAISEAFIAARITCTALNQIAIGLGLAGVHNKQWAQLFADKNPGFAKLVLETDAFTTLTGAHQGRPGVIVALGTGSCGESLSADGVRCEVSGWGFPFGDEAGGAWLGWHAIVHLQHVLDGRAAGSEFSAALLEHCGGNQAAVFNWLASASQSNYAQLAPLVVDFAARGQFEVATHIMSLAGQEIVKMAEALDSTKTLPVALCGGLAQTYLPYLPQHLLDRVVPPGGDSSMGALLMIKKAIEGNS